MATPIPGNDAPLTAWSAAAATGGTVAHVCGARIARGASGRDDAATARGITSDSRSV